jgi:hypothetical protein
MNKYILFFLLLLIVLCRGDDDVSRFRASLNCNDGKCTIDSCDDGFDDCNNDPMDGCEVNIDTDVNNCGACDYECPSVDNGVATCIAGECTVGLCDVPFADCNRILSDGCEIDLNNDIGHCGYCGMMCPIPVNGIPNCITGKCNIKFCMPGYADCNNHPSDGCEINLQSDPNHCGTCGTQCLSPEICYDGRCGVISCDGYTNCNGTCVDLTSDSEHCGKCGTQCTSPQICYNGSCICTTNCGVISCDGYTNCSGICVDLTNNTQNCGLCGNACPAGATCVGGICTCPTGQQLCPTTTGSPNQICVPINATQCTSCTGACPTDAIICVVSGNTGTCVSGGSNPYTDYGCVALAPTTQLGNLSYNTYQGIHTITDCFDYCNPTGATFFTLTNDISKFGYNIICECYSGKLNASIIIPDQCTGIFCCSGGFGVTLNGVGVVEAYAIP